MPTEYNGEVIAIIGVDSMGAMGAIVPTAKNLGGGEGDPRCPKSPHGDVVMKVSLCK